MGIQGRYETMNKNAADIFLCHSSNDKEFVRKLAGDLFELSIVAWFDEWELEPGDSLFDCIGKALEQSIYVGVILSPNSIESNWCKKELNQALSREIRAGKKVIIPIRLDKVDIPVFLEEKLYLNFTNDYFEPFLKLCGMIHMFSSRELNMAITKSPPKSIDDVKTILSGCGFDVEKLKSEEGQYHRLRNYAKRLPTSENLMNFGRICFQMGKDDEAKWAFNTILKNDSEFTSFADIDSNIRSLAKEKKPFKLNTNIRLCLSYLGLINDDEDMVLNSAYDCDEKEVLVNAGKFYLNTYDADIPCAIAYFIKATKEETVDSGWVRDCDDLIHQIMRDKKGWYPKISWDYIEKAVQEWNSHRWRLV